MGATADGVPTFRYSRAGPGRPRNTHFKDIIVKTATEVGVRAIQDHKVIEWNTYWKCRLSEGTDDM
jgi:hypothetical protein